MKNLALVIALCGMALTAQAVAGEAHVCRSPSMPMAAPNSALSDNTVFTCGGGVSGTIPQLAQKGWSVAQVLEQADMSNPSNSYLQLIIQKS